MHRIDNPSAAGSLPTPKPAGTPGYFTGGDPLIGEAATVVEADWMNAVQEEVSFVIESSGLVLSKTDRTQLAQALARLTRVRLTTDTMFYVADDGNDSNTGLSPSSPWATITHAYNFIRDRVDVNGYTPKIKLLDGVFTGAVLQFPVPGPHVIIEGNTTDPTKTAIYDPAGPAVLVQSDALVLLDSVTLRAAGSPVDYHIAGYGLAVFDATCQLNNVAFDSCQIGHMTADMGGIIGMLSDGAPYSIIGSTGVHAYSARGACLSPAAANITIEGVPTFSDCFARADRAATIDYHNASFNGTAHGKRYDVSTGAVINTGASGNPNFFPGDSDGTAEQGGIYW